MKVETNTTIDGHEVKLIGDGDIGGIFFYKVVNAEDDGMVIYITSVDLVIGKMIIEASEGQGRGYVSNVTLKEVK